MKLTIIGTGYVGLVSGACLADVGNDVYCVDINASKIEALKKGSCPIHEPGLPAVVERNIKEERLFFTTDLKWAVSNSEICFITVDTPPDGDGRADLTSVIGIAENLGDIIEAPKIVVTKSTVPVGTTLKVKSIISERLKKRGLDPSKLVSVASNPDFLLEGDAVNDFMKPDRVIVGVEDPNVAAKLHELYSPFMRKSDRFLAMDIASAELAKYAANSMLAVRISFMNEMARLCDRVGADIDKIRHALGTDPRIGPDFLYAGLGYGGSCFPKDMKALSHLGAEHGVKMNIIESADHSNMAHRAWFWNKISDHYGSRLSGRKIAVWGVAFKANTDDIRFAPSLDLMENLLKEGARVSVFDPQAQENGKKVFGQKVLWHEGPYDCLGGADALLVCTEWHEFRSPDFEKIKTLMKTPVIFDGRNLYDPAVMKSKGFVYKSVGR